MYGKAGMKNEDSCGCLQAGGSVKGRIFDLEGEVFSEIKSSNMRAIGEDSVGRLPLYDKLPRFIRGLGLSCADKLLYCELFNTALLSLKNGAVDKKGRAYVFCSQSVLAEKIEISRSTVSLSLKRLEDAGLIIRKESKRRATAIIYVMFCPEGESKAAEGGRKTEDWSANKAESELSRLKAKSGEKAVGKEEKRKTGSDGFGPKPDEYGKSGRYSKSGRYGKYEGNDEHGKGDRSGKSGKYGKESGTYGGKRRNDWAYSRMNIPAKERYGYSFEELESLDEFS